jgi:hypothetical protein
MIYVMHHVGVVGEIGGLMKLGGKGMTLRESEMEVESTSGAEEEKREDAAP